MLLTNAFDCIKSFRQPAGTMHPKNSLSCCLLFYIYAFFSGRLLHFFIHCFAFSPFLFPSPLNLHPPSQTFSPSLSLGPLPFSHAAQDYRGVFCAKLAGVCQGEADCINNKWERNKKGLGKEKKKGSQIMTERNEIQCVIDIVGEREGWS